VATGADITFKIVASGDSLEFQWQKDGDDIGTNESWLCSSKPNTSTLQIPCVKKSDQGHYRCLVKNPVECSEISSYEAEITVCKFVLILLQYQYSNYLHCKRMGIYIFCKHTTNVNVSYKLTVLHCAGRRIATRYSYKQGICLQ